MINKTNKVKRFYLIAIFSIILITVKISNHYKDLLSSSDNAVASNVVEMTRHAWNGYYKYARFSDELRPITQSGLNWTLYPTYLTPVDSLDTLYIMGLKSEYNQAKDIVLEKMDFNKNNDDLNHFEVNIRVLGGLLSAYSLDPDKRYLIKAVDLADRMLMAFDTRFGFPRSRFFMNINEQINQIVANANVSLATIGTLQLEFQYLSDLTGNPIYQDTALRVYEQLFVMTTPIPGLFPKYINVDTGSFTGEIQYGLDGGHDSFYEYLLKLYISTNDEKFKTWYKLASKVNF
jgi:mannosyl-oligosaccharide alpha-1,2-mannosidase